MQAHKQKRLEVKGWTVGTTKQFLDLTREEAARVEIRLKVAEPSKKPTRSSPS